MLRPADHGMIAAKLAAKNRKVEVAIAFIAYLLQARRLPPHISGSGLAINCIGDQL
jgi:hypothetical protein